MPQNEEKSLKIDIWNIKLNKKTMYITIRFFFRMWFVLFFPVVFESLKNKCNNLNILPMLDKRMRQIFPWDI